MSEVTARGPQVRVRIAHDSTVKEGWRCSETTVEYTSGDDGRIDWPRIADELQRAASLGALEAIDRNAISPSKTLEGHEARQAIDPALRPIHDLYVQILPNEYNYPQSNLGVELRRSWRTIRFGGFGKSVEEIDADIRAYGRETP